MKPAMHVLFLSLLVIAVAAHAEPVFLVDRRFQIGNSLGAQGLLAFSADNGVDNQIYLLDFAEQRVMRLIDGPGFNSSPAFSPDGTQLAFISDRDGDRELFISNWNGANQQQITFNDVDEDFPAWSPDGGTIFFSQYNLSLGKASLNRIELADIHQGIFVSRRVANFSGRNTASNASIDGQFLAYTTDRFFPGWDICLFNLSNSDNACILGTQSATFCRPRFSHNPNIFAYSAGIDGQIDLYLFNLSRARSTQISFLSGEAYDPVWSADDRYIVMSHSEPENLTQFSLHIVRMEDGAFGKVVMSEHSLRSSTWIEAKGYQYTDVDGCPTDPLKISPGDCGCGVSDVDQDRDEVPDCIDICPIDPTKTAPGLCGCGVIDPSVSGGDELICSPPVAIPAWLPQAPKVKAKILSSGRMVLVVQMQPREEATYQVFIKLGKKSRSIQSSSSKLKIPIKPGRKVSVSYQVYSGESVSALSATVVKSPATLRDPS